MTGAPAIVVANAHAAMLSATNPDADFIVVLFALLVFGFTIGAGIIIREFFR